MKRISQTKLNIASSLLLRAVSAVCGLILPRIVLTSFGSEANGLVAAVTQLLGYTVLLEGGIGGVMRAALYRPLSNRDMVGVSGVYHQISHTFRDISFAYIGFALFLSVFMKFLVDTQFDWMYVFTMVLILSINNYFSYYIALPQRLLMTADQKVYIIQFTQTITTIANLLMCVLVIRLGGGIHSVKLTTAVVFLVNPMVLRNYVKRNYALRKVSDTEVAPVPQKRDGVIHHLAFFIHRNTDVVILSLLSTLENVSAYTVYNMVISILEQFLSSISSGLSGAVGNLIAREEIKQLNQLVDRYETWSNALTTAVATVCGILILPFVSIYTKGVTDAQYYQPVFALLMIAGSYAYSIRHPFGCVVSAAGHYKETKAGAIGEVGINLILSLALVKPLGLVGVALGTFVAMSFRTVYTVLYLSKHILHRPAYKFFLKLACNLAASVALTGMVQGWFDLNVSSIMELFLCAVKISVIIFPAFIVMNIVLSLDTFKKDIEK